MIKEINIQEKLETVQKKSRERTVTTASISEIKNEIDKYLHTTLGIKRKNLEGVLVDYDANAQTFANAYHGKPESTHLVIVYDKKGHACVIDIYRGTCISHKASILFTDAAKTDITDHASKF